MRKLIVIAPIIAGALVVTYLAWSAGLLGPSVQKGVIYGKVTIGPICPVERENVPCSTPPETYRARKIVILTADATARIATADIDDNGNYRAELPAGTYTVDINHVGIDRSNDVPRTVTIEPEKSVRLDVSIDTGIR